MSEYEDPGIANYLKKLTEALSANYTNPNGLVGGSALQIEDLDVTLQCRTFDFPRWGTRREINKIIKHLIKRKIGYTLEEKPNGIPMCGSLHLTVGERRLSYWVHE
jgi:hypothetical protein